MCEGLRNIPKFTSNWFELTSHHRMSCCCNFCECEIQSFLTINNILGPSLSLSASCLLISHVFFIFWKLFFLHKYFLIVEPTVKFFWVRTWRSDTFYLSRRAIRQRWYHHEHTHRIFERRKFEFFRLTDWTYIERRWTGVYRLHTSSSPFCCCCDVNLEFLFPLHENFFFWLSSDCNRN